MIGGYIIHEFQRLSSKHYGTLFSPAQKSIRPGIEAVRYWLSGTPPHLQVFDDLEHFQAEIRQYRLKSPRGKDRPDPKDEPIKIILSLK